MKPAAGAATARRADPEHGYRPDGGHRDSRAGAYREVRPQDRGKINLAGQKATMRSRVTVAPAISVSISTFGTAANSKQGLTIRTENVKKSYGAG